MRVGGMRKNFSTPHLRPYRRESMFDRRESMAVRRQSSVEEAAEGIHKSASTAR